MEDLSYFLGQSPIVDTCAVFGKFKFGIIDCSHQNVPENYLLPLGTARGIYARNGIQRQPFMLIVIVTIIRVFSRSVTAYTVHLFRPSVYVYCSYIIRLCIVFVASRTLALYHVP